MIAQVGAERVLWASDFPHPDAIFPGAADTFLAGAQAAGAARDDLATVLWDAPLDFYRLAGRFGR